MYAVYDQHASFASDRTSDSYNESVKRRRKGNQERTMRQWFILAGTIIAVVILLVFIGRLIYQYRLSKKCLIFHLLLVIRQETGKW